VECFKSQKDKNWFTEDVFFLNSEDYAASNPNAADK